MRVRVRSGPAAGGGGYAGRHRAEELGMSWKHAALIEEVEGDCPILRRGHGSRAGRPQSEQTGGGVGVGVQKMSMGARQAK